jgi:hypothetical protein
MGEAWGGGCTATVVSPKDQPTPMSKEAKVERGARRLMRRLSSSIMPLLFHFRRAPSCLTQAR